MTSLSRDEIRTVPCPKCGAEAGKQCLYTGKSGLRAMHRGKNHFERMQLAQDELLRLDDIELVERFDAALQQERVDGGESGAGE